MAAYMVITREKTRDQTKLEEYRKLAPASFQKHPTANIRAIHGRREVLEGPAVEDVVIIEFPTYEAALAWYQSPEYQTASEHRFRGGDYRFILTEGLPAK
jgi:uncharacterized protein (DUF1330 family)